MGSINRVTLAGNLGADPVLRHTQSGKKVATVRLITSSGKDDSKKSQGHNLVLWETQAERLMRCKKGETIWVDGRLEYRSYEGRDGQKKYITEIICNWIMKDIPKPCQDDRAPAPDDNAWGGPDSPGVDDIPF